MPKLTLQFEGRVLKEFAVGPGMTIGRLPDNMVVIDNPAVSGHHACVYNHGDQVVLEDLKSTNGTFVNGRHVTRHTLQSGDAVLVGKHTLVFERAVSAQPVAAEPVLSGLGDTMYLDTKQHRSLLATLRNARAEADRAAGVWPTVSVPAAPSPAGVLRVVAGPAERPEYALDAQTSLIGKSDNALVRLRGWFKPGVAVAIARSAEGYVATPLGGKTTINGQALRERHDLQDGDVLCVSGLTLEFRSMDGASSDSARRGHAARSRLFMSSGERAATFRALT